MTRRRAGTRCPGWRGVVAAAWSLACLLPAPACALGPGCQVNTGGGYTMDKGASLATGRLAPDTICLLYTSELERDIAKRASQEHFDKLAKVVAQLPTREELKRFATVEQVLRLDKKMTVGFLTLLTLQLASSAPNLIDWGTKVVGYALR